MSLLTEEINRSDVDATIDTSGNPNLGSFDDTSSLSSLALSEEGQDYDNDVTARYPSFNSGLSTTSQLLTQNTYNMNCQEHSGVEDLSMGSQPLTQATNIRNQEHKDIGDLSMGSQPSTQTIRNEEL